MVSEDDIWRWLNKVSGAMDPMAVALAVAEVGADAAGASFANLAIVDPQTDWVRIVRGSSSLDPDIAARWAEFPLSARTPLGDAIQTGKPVFLGSPEAIGEHYPSVVTDTLSASLAATASLPVRAANGAILGATGFAWSRPQEFDENQVRQLDLVARLAGLALDRALLYEQRSHATEPVASEGPGGGVADQLTRREVSVLQLLAVGYTNAEIAGLLGVSLRTVESSRSRLRQSLGLRTRAQLVRYAHESGLTGPNR